MTAQISDTFGYRGKSFSLAGVNGKELFDPRNHGVQPESHFSACWRGFHCRYEVSGGHLHLAEIYLWLSDQDEEAIAHGAGPTLFGRSPERYKIRFQNSAGVFETIEPINHRITALHEPFPFTGGLLLADGFIEEMYVHMGFHPAYKYKEVHELILDAGRVIEEHDRSGKMKELREILRPNTLEPQSHANEAELRQWIERCFSLKYSGFGP